MEVIVLRDVPRRSCISALCKLLIAAPIAYSVTMGSWMILRRVSPVVAQAQAAPALEQPPLVTKAVLRSLPVPPLPRLPQIRPDVSAKASRDKPATGLAVTREAFVSPDGSSFQLEGVSLPDDSSRCRRLDGVELPCLQRIAARLQVLSATHPIQCEISNASGRKTARCFAGKIDVAEDLKRQGLASTR
jgi:hypothetical protein